MATAAQAKLVFDASEVEGTIVSTEKARSTKDLWGEPVQLSAVRIVHFDAQGTEGTDNYHEARDSVVGTFQSLANSEEFEAWVPDKFREVFVRFFEQHPGAVMQGRFFMDPVLNGKTKRGWQFCGLDQLPEDTTNAKLAGQPAEMPF